MLPSGRESDDGPPLPGRDRQCNERGGRKRAGESREAFLGWDMRLDPAPGQVVLPLWVFGARNALYAPKRRRHRSRLHRYRHRKRCAPPARNFSHPSHRFTSRARCSATHRSHRREAASVSASTGQQNRFQCAEAPCSLAGRHRVAKDTSASPTGFLAITKNSNGIRSAASPPPTVVSTISRPCCSNSLLTLRPDTICTASKSASYDPSRTSGRRTSSNDRKPGSIAKRKLLRRLSCCEARRLIP